MFDIFKGNHLFFFSGLTEKLELAQDLTKEAVQICQIMCLDSQEGKLDSKEQWFHNVSIKDHILMWKNLNCELFHINLAIRIEYL